MTDKQMIINDVDVSGCEWYSSTYFKPCDGCKNTPNCYYKQIKRKEQECEELKELVKKQKDVLVYKTILVDENSRVLENKLDQLEEENRSLKKQLQFEFDETLLQYSNIIEDLQKQLNNTVMQKCPQCGEVYLNPVGCELHEENQQLKAENKTQKETIDRFLTILDKLGKSNIKLRETLVEIKDIAEYCYDPVDKENDAFWTIVQKISECVVENGRTKED